MQTPAQFAAWIKQQQPPAQRNDSLCEGRAFSERNACINCHTIAGTTATGRFGHDLTHLATRDTIAFGSVPNTPKNLQAFVDDPAHFQPGALMPPMHLNPHHLDAVTQYLGTLKEDTTKGSRWPRSPQ